MRVVSLKVECTNHGPSSYSEAGLNFLVLPMNLFKNSVIVLFSTFYTGILHSRVAFESIFFLTDCATVSGEHCAR